MDNLYHLFFIYCCRININIYEPLVLVMWMHYSIYTADSRMCCIVHLSPVIPAEGTRSGSTACFSSGPCLWSSGGTVVGPCGSCSEQCSAGKPQACITEATGLYPWARCAPFTFCHNDHWLIPLSSLFCLWTHSLIEIQLKTACCSQHNSNLCSVVLQLVLTCIGHCQIIGIVKIKVRQYLCYQTIMFVVSCFPAPFPHSLVMFHCLLLFPFRGVDLYYWFFCKYLFDL